MSILTEKYNILSSMEKAIDVDPHNNRIKVYQLPTDLSINQTMNELKEIGEEYDCDKIIFYTDEKKKEVVENLDCSLEGKMDGFFQGQDAYIYSTFLDPSRNQLVDRVQEEKVMQIVTQDTKQAEWTDLPKGYHMRNATLEDVEDMAQLYDTVFETYPTPMDDPNYIAKVMQENTYFTLVHHNNELVSACAADVLPAFNAAEMTDCATLPEHRGNGLLSQQFIHLENRMQNQKVQTLFSYTRAVSVGMNLINARHGYTFGGRMIQNTNIAGRMEDMNIWVKTL